VALAGRSGFLEPWTDKPTHNLVQTPVDISKITVHAAPPPAMGMWLEVTLGFTVDCTEHLQSFSSSWDYSDHADKLIDLYVSAVVSAPIDTPDIKCLGFQYVEKVISMPGMFLDESQIQLIQLSGEARGVNLESSTVTPAEDVKILKIASTCPALTSCIQEGTVVTLEVMTDCGDQIAATYLATNKGEDELMLAASVFLLKNMELSCMSQGPVTKLVEITLDEPVLSVSDLSLVPMSAY
jgi:hypothetical protein